MSAFTFAVIGLALSVAGSIKQNIDTKKGQKQAQRNFDEGQRLKRLAEEKQQKVADLQTLRAKRKASREAQARRADIVSGAENAGANEGGSAVPGATGSVRSQIASNLSFLDRSKALNTQTVALLGDANAIANKPVFTSGIGTTIAGIGGTIFDNNEKISKNFFGKT